MEYYIFLTHNCNMRCSYCCAKRILSSDHLALTPQMMDKIIEYISRNNRDQNNSIVFFGGEPLLEWQVMDDFMKKTSELNLSYSVYTNGLLLDSVPIGILRSLDTIFVSIDGDKDSHEKHRGRGTYQKIITNLKTIKPKLNGFIMGRITVEEETNIYKSVTNILNFVDAIYWQIVNKAKFNNANAFLKQYKENVRRLFEFWLTNFKRGKLFNIIPFQAIISSLVFDYKKHWHSFRCDAGTAFQAIDLDGNIYWCDEYIGHIKGIIGNINGNKPSVLYESHEEIFEDCRECKISAICLGRCKKCLKEYSTEQIRNYCNLTKFLIETILEYRSEIEKVINRDNYNLKSFYSIPDCTEEIP